MIGRQWAYSLLSTAAVGLAVIGCSGGGGGDDKPREPVSGTVTLDGQPLPAGVILFAPAGHAEEAVASASGQIENGEFSIPREQGPVPGDYKVSISHTDQPEGHVKVEFKKGGKKAAPPKELIPSPYNGPKTKLTAKVPRGGAKDLKFELRSK